MNVEERTDIYAGSELVMVKLVRKRLYSPGIPRTLKETRHGKKILAGALRRKKKQEKYRTRHFDNTIFAYRLIQCHPKMEIVNQPFFYATILSRDANNICAVSAPNRVASSLNSLEARSYTTSGNIFLDLLTSNW